MRELRNTKIIAVDHGYAAFDHLLCIGSEQNCF